MGTRLLTGATANPATVTVPYGDVATETVVTFTNTVDPTEFKICKQESRLTPTSQGATFDFSWSFTAEPLGTVNAPDSEASGSIP